MSWLPQGLASLGSIDPSPFFALSLFPYLAFLRWAWRSRRFPPLALIGFALTLLFVAITIVAALVAQWRYGEVLANVDALHGGAESFLTLSNLLVLLGFSLGGQASPSEERPDRAPIASDPITRTGEAPRP